MYILAVDDERLVLMELINELKKVFPDGEIHGEQDPFKAEEWAKELEQQGKKLDYAFLDVRMSGMNGLELARCIKSIHHDTRLIFCTAYTEYAFDAVGMYAKGYLLKPIRSEEIIQTLDEMVHDWRKSKSELTKDIRVRTFGHFEIFVEGTALTFEREKAKELLAYLVDRHGSSVTTEQIAGVLWEDRPYDRTLKNYVSTIFASMKNTLKSAGIDDIIIKSRNHLAIDPNKIKCDAYDFEKWDTAAVNSFKGEYMVNYSWAEFTTGKYVRMEMERTR